MRQQGFKTAATLKSASKLKKTKESEVSITEIINILKPGSDEVDIKLRQTKDQELQSLILPGDTSPVVELDQVDSTEGEKNMPPTRCF